MEKKYAEALPSYQPYALPSYHPHSGDMEKEYAEAEAAGNCLRFVGVVDVPGEK